MELSRGTGGGGAQEIVQSGVLGIRREVKEREFSLAEYKTSSSVSSSSIRQIDLRNEKVPG